MLLYCARGKLVCLVRAHIKLLSSVAQSRCIDRDADAEYACFPPQLCSGCAGFGRHGSDGTLKPSGLKKQKNERRVAASQPAADDAANPADVTTAPRKKGKKRTLDAQALGAATTVAQPRVTEQKKKERKAKRLASAHLTQDAEAVLLKQPKKLKQPGSRGAEVASAAAISAETEAAIDITKPKKRRKQNASDTGVLHLKISERKTIV